jgi:magnesium transporter
MVGAIYGMNFRYMPELTWRWGYPLVLLLTVGVMVLLYRRLRSAGWL